MKELYVHYGISTARDVLPDDIMHQKLEISFSEEAESLLRSKHELDMRDEIAEILSEQMMRGILGNKMKDFFKAKALELLETDNKPT